MTSGSLPSVTGRSTFTFERRADGGIDISLDSGTHIKISREGVEAVKEQVRSRRHVGMGASRDNPPRDTLGRYLLDNHIGSPQWLTYLVPILAAEGFCSVTKEGSGFFITHRRTTGG